MRKAGRKGALAACIVAASVLGINSMAGADTIGVTVVPGERSANITDLVLPPVKSDHEVWYTSGTANLWADDSSGSGAGWTVTVQAADFTGPGSIPAQNLSILYTHPVAHHAGQAIDAVNGPFAPGQEVFGTLDQARPVLKALPGSGMGTYSQHLGLMLEVPADTLAGDYTTTLTVSITAAP